jgi:phage portal protein BeeE
MGAFDSIRNFLNPPNQYEQATAEAVEANSKFSPGVPINPADGFSRSPRAHDFLTGYNIAARPRRNERVSFQTLRGVIEAYDIAQMAITHRIDSVRSLDWFLEPIDGYEEDCSKEIAFATRILKRPDHELPFRAWLSKFLWDVLAYDAGTLYRMRNNAGRAIGLKVVDGTTIAPLIDYHGSRPLGDAAAYVQFAQGVPWNWLTNDDIVYVPFRPMPNSPYGKSPLESVLLNANTDLRFQNYFLARFTEGTMPEGFATAPESWGADQVADFQDAWDALMYGDESKKHQIRWVPGGTSFTFPKESNFDAEFSLFLMRKTAAAYHVTPNDLGFTDTVNLANGETQTEVQFRVGDLPLIQHLQDILTSFLQDDLDLPLKFRFNVGGEKDDRLMSAQIAQIMINSGVLSPSEVRTEVYGLQEPDGQVIPRFISSGQGPIPIANLFAIAGPVDAEAGMPVESAPLPESFTPAVGVLSPAPVEKSGDEREEQAAFKRFVKARKRDGKWRDFTFEYLEDDDAMMANWNARLEVEGYRESGDASSHGGRLA